MTQADSVLVALHYQNENCHPEGKIRIGLAADAEDWRRDVMAAAGRLLAGARSCGVPLVHVRYAMHPGHANLVPNAPIFRQIIDQDAWVEGTWGTEFITGLEPAGDEIVVGHARMNGFFGSQLAEVLAHWRPRHLVLAGVSTAYVVEATARHAVDAGFEVSIAHDACATGSRQAHEASLAALGLLCEIQGVDDIVAAWR
ncbi:MAG TPA: isochorismatase family cysteine hydrolase [Alphaproteobacteria bacterium]|jgi:nicotinamidase-related amidase|nr:isochorismatase family cysteine hydrolase [Alphaproteobacteria bacterium]MDP6268965.1 isochorismatase family cysteine hydrolase [Alphaproteobacteria bacterium]MDP7427233.1 isochorismatase family cysteine hydrolase [Alphaproteobacteria bacterium]HJM50100.1 isochorismatase family cysteine hydrolase [Alphaproteobacteria bacterium]